MNFPISILHSKSSHDTTDQRKFYIFTRAIQHKLLSLVIKPNPRIIVVQKGKNLSV